MSSCEASRTLCRRQNEKKDTEVGGERQKVLVHFGCAEINGGLWPPPEVSRTFWARQNEKTARMGGLFVLVETEGLEPSTSRM